MNGLGFAITSLKSYGETQQSHYWAYTLREGTITEKDTCTSVFFAALFTIARAWKQPRCPSADEWIRKLWYIYTMEYYSAIKKNIFDVFLSGLLHSV